MKRRILLNIADKIDLEEDGLFCPPHRLPHTLPFIGELVTDEPCHYHEAKWRMLHHKPFCKLLGCPNYDRMVEAYRGYQDQLKQEQT